MVDRTTGFESEDVVGSSAHYNGSVTTTISLPSVANKVISEFYIENMSTTPLSILQFSLDAGVNWKSVDVRGFMAWSLKGRKTQIQIRSKNGGSVSYEILINYEEY